MTGSFDFQGFVDAQAAVYSRVIEDILAAAESRAIGCGSSFPRLPASGSAR
jgi:uncharacterized protein (DUF1810 family)